MFRSAEKLDQQRITATLSAKMDAWRGASDGWFDGSVDSVDRRLAKCSRLLNIAKSAVGRNPEPVHLATVTELSADYRSLQGMRDDLLTGASDREAGYTPPGRRLANHANIRGADRRWVILEAARFFADNDDVRHSPPELAERARRHAEAQSRSRAMTAAFIEAVVDLSNRSPRPKMAAAASVFTGFDDAQMFL